jgi:hypothetical protein
MVRVLPLSSTACACCRLHQCYVASVWAYPQCSLLACSFRMLDVNGSGAVRQTDLLTVFTTLAPQHLSQLVVESGCGDASTTAAECAELICRPHFPEGITEGKFAAMIASRSAPTDILLGNLVAAMAWEGALCLGTQL